MTIRKYVTVICLVILFGATALRAEVTVMSVTGTVNYKTDKQWKPLQKGMKIPQGAKISTGVGSSAVIRMDGHEVTIKPLSMMMIEENRLTGDVSSNRIGLRRGSVRASISKETRVKTVFRISTPVATSSVRGTIEEASHGPAWGSDFAAVDNNIETENANGERRDLKEGLSCSQSNDNPSGGDVLDDTKDSSNASLADTGLTDTERDSNDFSGSDTVDTTSDTGDVVDTTVGGTANVNVDVVFP